MTDPLNGWGADHKDRSGVLAFAVQMLNRIREDAKFEDQGQDSYYWLQQFQDAAADGCVYTAAIYGMRCDEALSRETANSAETALDHALRDRGWRPAYTLPHTNDEILIRRKAVVTSTENIPAHIALSSGRVERDRRARGDVRVTHWRPAPPAELERLTSSEISTDD